MNDKFNSIFPSNSERLNQQNAVAEHIGNAIESLGQEPVAPKLDVESIESSIQSFDFDRPEETVAVAGKIVELMKGGMVHMMHPGYFGVVQSNDGFPRHYR